VTEKRLNKAEEFFKRHGGKIVGVARFVDGLRQLNGVVAGIAGMPWRRFLAFNALGAVVWVTVWTSVGYFAGGHLTAIYQGFHRYQIVVLAAAGALILAALARWLWRRRHQRTPR
jgi:membrane protein DedA with SNARE-associated domain